MGAQYDVKLSSSQCDKESPVLCDKAATNHSPTNPSVLLPFQVDQELTPKHGELITVTNRRQTKQSFFLKRHVTGTCLNMDDWEQNLTRVYILSQFGKLTGLN